MHPVLEPNEALLANSTVVFDAKLTSDLHNFCLLFWMLKRLRGNRASLSPEREIEKAVGFITELIELGPEIP